MEYDGVRRSLRARLHRLGHDVPRAVWAACALFTASALVWTVAVPLFHGPDEPQHVDLIAYLAEHPRYPAYDGHHMGVVIRRTTDLYLGAGGGARHPDLGGRPAPDLGGRHLDDPGATAENPKANVNQLPQHPPAYYEGLAGLLRIERAVVPEQHRLGAAQEIYLLRLVDVALMASLPLAIWLLTRRLGGSDRAALAAAVAATAVPQLTHIAAVVNNDDLLTIASAWLAVPVASLTRAGPSRSRTHAIGALLALCCLTKAFGLLFVPWVALAHALSWRRVGGGRLHLASLGTVATWCFLGAGWFWLAVLRTTGTLTPTNFFDRAPTRPAGSAVDHGIWVDYFVRHLPVRFWGSFGRYAADLPGPVVAVACLTLGVALVVAFVPRVGRLVTGGVDRAALACALVPALTLLAYVAQHAHEIYVRTTWFNFIQGRYLFAAVAPMAAVAAIGLDRLGGRIGPRQVWTVAVALQAMAARVVLRVFWSADRVGTRTAVRTAVEWCPMPARAVVAMLAVSAALGAWASRTVWIDRASRPPSEAVTP